MDKNQKILLMIIGILVIVSAVIGFLAFKNQRDNNQTSTNKFKEEYESLNGVVNDNGYTYPTVEIDIDNPIVYATEEEIVEILEDGTGLIYFGFPTCPWCRNMVPSLLSAASSKGLDKIYYLNVLNIRDSLSVSDTGEIITEKEGTESYYKILEELDEILDEYYVKDATEDKIATGEKRLYVPTVVAVVDGKVVDYHMNTVESHMALKNGYIEMTKEQREELFEIYVSMINKITNSSCDEKDKC